MPPAPLVPAMGEYSNIEITLSTIAATLAGKASLSWECQLICQVDPPDTSPTAVTSDGNSRRAFSSKRAKNGVPATTIGITAAGMPIVVPVSQKVNGMIAAISTRNGSERPILTIQLRVRLTAGRGNSP